MCEKNASLKVEIENVKSKLFNYKNTFTDKSLFKSITSIEPDDFQAVFDFLDTGTYRENIKYYDTKNDKPIKEYPQSEKPGVKPKLSAVNQFFLYLTWLRNGLTLSMVSLLFGIRKSTVSRYLITWSNLLYFSLGKINIWPTKEQVLRTMPKTFKELYPSTRCIIDCTEIFCQRPSSLAAQSS